MSDAPALIYLETDDEITTVVRRMRAAEPGRVVIVAPGRSRATSSTLALRLLARAAEEDGRQVSVVGDALTRSLAAEAGLSGYASVADARRADPAASPEPAASEPHTAAIHVVRGEPIDDSAPTLAAVAAVTSEPPARLTREAETRAVAVPRRRPGAPPARRRPPGPMRRTRRRLPMVAVAVLALAILVAWGAVAAVVLPAAAITIVPRSEPIGPILERITVTDVDRVAGTATETVTVVPTQPYEVNEPAVGQVTFFNFTFANVTVPQGSLVATGQEEGDQAYRTDEAVTVPPGSFFGGITAGEASVNVTAAAPGPDGNVPAGAIDTVLDPVLASQLRGFPNIREALVTNPAPTQNGATETGMEFSEQDVQAATDRLVDALREAVTEALAESEDRPHADATETPDPTIEGAEDLAGRRDADSVELRGSLGYDRLVADPAAIEEQAAELLSDAANLPEGWQLVEDDTRVEIGSATREGDALTVDVTVSGRRTRLIDRHAVLERVIGLSKAEAEAEIADMGTATVELWPAWVGTVPDNDWRIDLQVAEGQ